MDMQLQKGTDYLHTEPIQKEKKKFSTKGCVPVMP